MVSMWYMDDDEEADQRLPHQTDPPRMVGVEALRKCTGVLYWKIDVNLSPNAELQKLCKERGYNYEDLIEIHPSKLVNYEEKLKIFYEEHLHSDEEIRLILEGSGYFDVRDHNDKWIRIEMVKGDLIILPAGIYHRFTLDSKNYIKASRFFVGEPVWTPYKRPADSHPARIQYLKEQQTAALCLTA